jgi:hypothetical protein
VKEDKIVYVVTAGCYEEKCNVLVTNDLTVAINRFLKEDEPNTIEIWKNEKLTHEYGMYTFDEDKDFETIFLNIKFIVENGQNRYLTKKNYKYAINN